MKKMSLLFRYIKIFSSEHLSEIESANKLRSLFDPSHGSSIAYILRASRHAFVSTTAALNIIQFQSEYDDVCPQ